MTKTPNGPRPLSPAALALLARRADVADHPNATPLEQGPLSFSQLPQWFFAHLYPQSTVFNLPKILTLRGRVDQPALRRCLQAIVERQTALRTVYKLEGDEPTQRVLAARPIDLSCHDLRSASTDDRWRLAGELLGASAGKPFDLSSDQLLRAVLIRLSDDDWRLQVTFHHIAFDGWSTGVFLADFEQEYRAAVKGVDSPLLPLQSQVPDVAARQRAQADTPAFDQVRRYWRDRLRGVPPLDLTLDHSPAPVPQHRGGQVHFHLNAEVWASVLTFAREHDCTPFAVLFAAWAVLTARRCNQARCLLGVTLAGRTHAESEPLIGNFINVLPLEVDLDSAPTFTRLVEQVRQRSAEVFSHQHFPFQLLTSDVAPAGHSSTETPFPALFNLRNLPFALPQNLPDLRVTELVMPLRGVIAPLNLNVTPKGSGALLEFDFDPGQITATTADRWLDAYVTLLGAALAAPETEVIRLPVMGTPEKEQLAAWNQTDRPRDRTVTLPALLARQAAATPDRIAVTTPDDEWTYHKLAREAQRIARVLRRRGIGPGSFVAVCMDRCAGLVAALAGILEAGAAPLPIDPVLPRIRIIGMLEDAGVTVLLSGPGTSDGLGGTRWTQLPWDAPDIDSVCPFAVRPLTAEDPAYLMFTSGSTGRPKGVVVLQSGIVNELEWTLAAFPLQPNDVLLQHASISADVSIWEFWLPLITGARLVVAAPGDHRDPNALIDLIRTQRVSVLQVGPTMLRALLDTGRFGTTGSLRLVLPVGEALTWDVIAAFRQAHSAPLVNLYGPTEVTIHSTFWVADARAGEGPVPIGRPIANTQAHVLDRHGEMTPIGVQGELSLAGEGVAHGYLNRPELTTERFVADRFRPGPGRMMYHTGDLVRWSHDGLLEFFGRADTQVKLRGFRVELGEIEAALGAVSGVRAAAVVLKPGPSGEQRLVGYVEPAAAGNIDAAMLRTALRQQLPDYMVPSVIFVMPALPLTSSGKIDRTALRPPTDASSLSDDAACAAESASTALEQALQDLWGQVLGATRVGLDDDFFDLGGHSLLAAKMVNALERSTGYRVPLATLFDASTVRTFARALVNQSSPNDDASMREVQAGAPGKRPFFMLTGDWTRRDFYCRGLANAVNPDQPFYAIPPLPPSSDIRLATIEGMAGAHLAEIRQRQPAGPYRLGGYCIGGLLAYEIASLLRAKGEEVELLLLVDPVAPRRHAILIHAFARTIAALASRDPQTRLDRRAHLAARAADVVMLPWRQRLAMIAEYPLRFLRREIDRRHRTTATSTPINQPGATPDPALYAMGRHQNRAQALYRHGRYPGRVDLVRSRNSARPAVGHWAAWRRLAPGVVLHEGQADHDGVVLHDLQTILRDQLTRIDNERNG